jgi:hypothetical protein
MGLMAMEVAHQILDRIGNNLITRQWSHSRKIPVTYYAIMDYFMAALAWGLFFFLRKLILKEPVFNDGHLLTDEKFWAGYIFIYQWAGWPFIRS